MRELVKLMLIPIVGCVAVALIFLFFVYGGKYETLMVSDTPKAGLATLDLEAADAILVDTGTCDTSLYTPVCGFDGTTYDNPCLAARGGTRVAHRGVCT